MGVEKGRFLQLKGDFSDVFRTTVRNVDISKHLTPTDPCLTVHAGCELDYLVAAKLWEVQSF